MPESSDCPCCERQDNEKYALVRVLPLGQWRFCHTPSCPLGQDAYLPVTDRLCLPNTRLGITGRQPHLAKLREGTLPLTRALCGVWQAPSSCLSITGDSRAYWDNVNLSDRLERLSYRPARRPVPPKPSYSIYNATLYKAFDVP